MDRRGSNRRQLLWQTGIRQSGVGELALAYGQEAVELPALSPLQELGWEQMVTGVSPAHQVMAFYREDEKGMVNVVVRPRVYEQYPRVLHQGRVLVVTGIVKRQGAVVNVLAERFAAAEQNRV